MPVEFPRPCHRSEPAGCSGYGTVNVNIKLYAVIYLITGFQVHFVLTASVSSQVLKGVSE